MTCEEFEAHLTQVLSGSPVPETDMQQHMQTCEACRIEYETLSRTIGQLDAWQPIEAPVSTAELRALSRVARIRPSRTSAHRAWRILAPIAVGVAAAVVLFVMFTGMGAVIERTPDGWIVAFGEHPKPTAATVIHDDDASAMTRAEFDRKLVTTLESVSSTMVALLSRQEQQTTELVRAVDALLARERTGLTDYGVLAFGERDTR